MLLLLLLLLSTLIDDAASSITVLMHVNLRTTAEQLLLQAAQSRAALRLLRELKLHSIRTSREVEAAGAEVGAANPGGGPVGRTFGLGSSHTHAPVALFCQ